MLSLPSSPDQRDHIRLSDRYLEQSRVVKVMLDIIYTMDVDFRAVEELVLVVDLAEKWDFQHVPKLIQRELHRCDFKTVKSRWQTFKLSTRLKDPVLMARCVDQHHTSRWSHKPSTPTGVLTKHQISEEPAPGLKDESSRLDGVGMYEVGGWGYKAFLRKSPTVIWALLRAIHVGTIEEAEIDHNKAAKEFERLLTLACEPHINRQTHQQTADIQTSQIPR